MKSDPCKVCGNTDMNLMDGYYYCVECGTQDTNIVETLVEDLALKDGTFAIRLKTRVKKIVREVEKVSPEWYKWQACNYMLSGMVKEMMDLGAGPKFKMRVMWLWTLYVKRFQNKQELGLSSDADDADEQIESTVRYNRVFKTKRPSQRVKLFFEIKKVTVNLLLTIIYLALNFDRSEILVSDLTRFIREGRLSYKNSRKYVPEEINANIDGMHNRIAPMKDPNVEYINTQAMTFLKTLDLGCPIVPNIGKIVERYVKELCLPEGFKDLIFSLMNLVPCDFLELDQFIITTITSVPFYEARVMAYILVALKMCFGLDDEYENKLSDAVDYINNENCHMKCYKLGVFSTSSDRLFSFREWVKFLQLRKLVLCRSYIPLSVLYQMDVDDYIYMEQRDVKLPYRTQPSVTDDITMSLLEKIGTDTRKEVITKKEFPRSLTPFTDYTDVVLKHCHDPEIRLLLSEDFTQYSLKYAYESLDLRISDDSKNIIEGVNETNKCIKSEIKSQLNSTHHIRRDYSLVYIRNCENKHWMKTKRPKQKHIKKVKTENDTHDDDIDSSDNDSDSESSIMDDKTIDEDDCNVKKLQFIEEDKCVNIFDDDFQNLEEYEPKDNKESLDIKEEPIDEDNVEFNSQIGNLSSIDAENSVSKQDIENQDVLSSFPDEDVLQFFNPETFDREGTIKHLIFLACKKHKIAIPKEYKTIENKEPRKRKIENVNKENDDGIVPEKKPKTRAKPGETQKHVNILLAAYYDSLRHDVFSAVSHCVRDLVEGLERTQDDLNSEDQVDGGVDNNLESYRIESNQTENAGNGHNTSNADDPSIVEVQNQTLDESVVAETENTNKGDPKFDDKIYDIKQLYLTPCEENFEDIFDIHDDPDVDRIITQKIEEESVSLNSKLPIKVDDNIEDGFSDWDDEVPLSEIKALMVERKKVPEGAFEKNLKYLVSNRKETKNNYWVRHEAILCRLQNRVDSFTNEMKETYPKSFSFLIMECAAMLDCTPFILYKYMVWIEEFLIRNN